MVKPARFAEKNRKYVQTVGQRWLSVLVGMVHSLAALRIRNVNLFAR